MNIKIINKSKHPLPKYETIGSAGMDLIANLDNDIILKCLDRALIPTGLFLELPNGIEAQIRARSGLSLKYGVTTANGIGTIDSDYRGEIGVILVNLSKENFVVKDGMRIAQMIFAEYKHVDLINVKDISDSKRGSGGFGHTGV